LLSACRLWDDAIRPHQIRRYRNDVFVQLCHKIGDIRYGYHNPQLVCHFPNFCRRRPVLNFVRKTDEGVDVIEKVTGGQHDAPSTAHSTDLGRFFKCDQNPVIGLLRSAPSPVARRRGHADDTASEVRLCSGHDPSSFRFAKGVAEKHHSAQKGSAQLGAAAPVITPSPSPAELRSPTAEASRGERIRS